MNNRDILNLYGLKWNPFSYDLPREALQITPKAESFCYRVENLLFEGGYAMITGHPGTGKSVVLRLLAQRLEKISDVKIGILVRPQSGASDFYRELGDLFGLDLKAGNKWHSYKNLRKKWIEHIQTTLFRPVLLIDEAQEMQTSVLNELRLLSSHELDAKMILTTIFCGDTRFPEKFKTQELIPLGSRIKVRLQQDAATKEDLLRILKTAIERAGNPDLMTPELMELLCDHAAGNFRVLMNMGSNLLSEAAQKKQERLNESLFFETFNISNKKGKKSVMQ